MDQEGRNMKKYIVFANYRLDFGYGFFARSERSDSWPVKMGPAAAPETSLGNLFPHTVQKSQNQKSTFIPRWKFKIKNCLICIDVQLSGVRVMD